MNSHIKPSFIKVTLLAAALLATCLVAESANAQTTVGRVTLPYETHWGQSVLPAGDYTLSLATIGKPLIVIRNAKNGRTVFVAPRTREYSTLGRSALFVAVLGRERVVHSFRVAELGVTFISEPALARGREASEEARETQVVPVFSAAK